MIDPLDDRVFVAIAAYREPEVADTIASCLDRAAKPELLRFGVCLQYDDSLPGAGADALDRVADRATVEQIRLPFTEARGGCWARYQAQGLYDGEGFTLQVDAHSRMGDGWDDELRSVLRELPSDKPLLTGFPPLYDLIDDDVQLREDADLPLPITVVEHWSHDGWIHHPVIPAPTEAPRAARRTRVLSGAFVFTVGRWNVEVRQDPEHLYAGEEFALTLRSFTQGYDLWNPPRRVVWHRHHPGGNPKYILDDPDQRFEWRHARACKRLRLLLAGDPDGVLGPFGLGSDRTLDDYRRFSGLDHETYEIAPAARLGIEPTWPPSP